MVAGVQADVRNAKDPVRTVWMSDRSRAVPVSEPLAQRFLLKRRKDVLAGRGRSCDHPPNILQRYGTCWFNAMCNVLCNSDRGRDLMYALYVDWVLGIRAPGDAQRTNLLSYFRFMLDLTEANPVVMERFRPVKTEALLKKLHRYSPAEFPNIGRNHGNFPGRYMKQLMIFLGVPKESIVYVNAPRQPSDTFWSDLQDRLQARKTLPLVLMVFDQWAALEETPSKLMMTRMDGRLYRYMLDAKQMSSGSWQLAKSGHAIAGITCGGSHYLMDSNQGPRSFVPYDWRSSTQPTSVTTAPKELFFQGIGLHNVAIYYCAEKLKALSDAANRVSSMVLDLTPEQHATMGSRHRNYLKAQFKKALSVGNSTQFKPLEISSNSD
jgi:hypothetical protein